VLEKQKSWCLYLISITLAALFSDPRIVVTVWSVKALSYSRTHGVTCEDFTFDFTSTSVIFDSLVSDVS